MLILGIESSCDDTSVALLDCSDQGCVVVSEITASQIEIHKKYGGVVPEIAGRMHAEKIVPLIEEVLTTPYSPPSKGGDSDRSPSALPPACRTGRLKKGEKIRPDAIAVTAGPGLITGLIVGVEAARTLSYAWGIPLVAVNHIDGHIHSVELGGSPITYPALALVVSGGHTELIFIEAEGKYKKIGVTKDDAAGECFDKAAKLLGLPYPGGPQISKLAETGNTTAIKFPRPMIHDDNYNFSFSGLKTSALYWLRDHKLSAIHLNPLGMLFSWMPSRFGQATNPPTINDFCASFEQAIVDVLITKTVKAVTQYQPKTIILAGGVAANKKLRETLKIEITNRFPNSDIRIPTSDHCMDNAAMIAVAGYYQAKQNNFTDWKDIQANPNWEL
ncbi:MAG: tRNA (adenosine(37)-N6)-threonylcarbamoyltransferase complex transferase subunit TsaD [bacterium]|nr:tRNA (adenosine(37)-N6)-threonylcarbamoyltransferase complex transferase subunit TsaD [bacterium]